MSALKWTRDPPAEAGWYWWRSVYTKSGNLYNAVRVVEVKMRDAWQDDGEVVQTLHKAMCAIGVSVLPYDATDPKHAEWSGPIPEPEGGA